MKINGMKIFFVCTLSAMSVFSFGQNVPGYLGKKNNAGYKLGVNIAGESSEITGSLGLVCNHQLSFERVLSRKASFEADFAFAPSKFYVYHDFDFNNDNSSAPEYLSSFSPDYYFKAYYSALTAGFKFYRKQFIAPVGRFIKFKVGLFQYGLLKWKEGMPGTFYVVEAGNPYYTTRDGFLKTENNVRTGFLFGIGMGKVIPLSDKLMFEFGTNLNFNYSSDYGFDPFNRQTSESSVDEYVFSNLHVRMKYRNLFDISFALKYNF